MTTTTATPDLEAVKAKQQATWTSGDYAIIGTTLQIVGETLCEAADVRAGEQVLDVAAGNGNASLAAARRYAEVTATDYVGRLLERAAERARADGVALTTREADAENLPFDDDTFDAVLSTFGVMFTPDHHRAGAELVRVCRPGGRIGLANWTPEGFIGGMFKIVGAHVPPPAGVASPLQWGNEDHVREVLAGADVSITRRYFTFRYRSAMHMFETFRDFYGPTFVAWKALDDDGRRSFQEALVAHFESANRGGASSLVCDAEYLEVVATKH